jgi:hypothetical protein
MASIQSGTTSSPKFNADQQHAINGLIGSVQALDKELAQSHHVISELCKFVQVNELLNKEIDALDLTLKNTVPFVAAANIWMNDALAHEQVLENICGLMSSPDFLLYWTFETFKKLRMDEAGFDAIADAYLDFLQTKGKYNPNQPQRQNSFNQVPYPPAPGQNTPQVDAKVAAVDLMRSGNPDAARILQRARMQGAY